MDEEEEAEEEEEPDPEIKKEELRAPDSTPFTFASVWSCFPPPPLPLFPTLSFSVPNSGFWFIVPNSGSSSFAVPNLWRQRSAVPNAIVIPE